MKYKLRPFFKDVSLTFITQGIILVALIFIYRLIARNFGPEGVGEYSLIKRIVAFFQPVLLLGLGVGIPRYIAMSQSKEQRIAYLKAGGLTIAVLTFIFLIFVNLFKKFFAGIFFGTTDYVTLVLPFSLFLAGLTLHILVYSCFRGRLLVKTFNLLQVINVAMVPVGILILFQSITIEKLISLIGFTTFFIAFLFSLFFVKELFTSFPERKLKPALNELLKYGIPRLPGDFALSGLLSLGPIFAAHFSSIKEVGYLSISQSLLPTAGAIISPLGLVLLPKVSNLIINEREETIKENLNLLIMAVIQCSIFVCAQLIIFTDVIIKHWLGDEFLNAVPVMRIIFLSIFFYAFYVAIRSVLDAVKVKPLNTINLFMSLGVFITVSGILLLANIFSPIISLSIAFTSAFICLGLLSYISVRKIYSEDIKEDIYCLGTALAVNILLGGLAIYLKPFMVSKFYYLIFFIAGTGLTYFLILWLLKMKWIRQIPEIIFEKYVCFDTLKSKEDIKKGLLNNKKICMFVYNNCKHDARVLKEARTLAQAGYNVRVIAVLDDITESYEERDGFRIIRVKKSFYYRLLRGFKRFFYHSLKEVDVVKKILTVLFWDLTPARYRLNRSQMSASTYRAVIEFPYKIFKLSIRIFHKPLSYLDYYRRCLEVVRQEPADVYHAHDLNTLPVAYLAKHDTEGKVIYDSHELYTETSTLSSLERAISRPVEKYLIRRVDRVITVNRSIANELSSRYQIPSPSVLMNCSVVNSQPCRHESNLLQKKLGLDDKLPIILYQGGYALNRGLKKLILSAHYISEGIIVFMGWGRIEQALKHLAASEGLCDRIRFTEPVPQNLLLNYTMSASLGVIPYQFVGLNNYYTTPNKLFEYIAAGIPVVGSNFPELKRIIEEYCLGRTFNPEDPKDIAEAINYVLSDKNRYNQMKENAKKAARIFNWENESRKLLQVYGSLK